MRPLQPGDIVETRIARDGVSGVECMVGVVMEALPGGDSVWIVELDREILVIPDVRCRVKLRPCEVECCESQLCRDLRRCEAHYRKSTAAALAVDMNQRMPTPVERVSAESAKAVKKRLPKHKRQRASQDGMESYGFAGAQLASLSTAFK